MQFNFQDANQITYNDKTWNPLVLGISTSVCMDFSLPLPMTQGGLLAS